MERSLTRYREGIQSGALRPCVRWDQNRSATIFDPAEAGTPLECMGFGVYRLDEGPFEIDSGERELLFMPVEGEFEFVVDGQTFVGARPGGAFATLPARSNASVVYVGRGQKAGLKGTGVMIWFSAPAFGDRPAAFVPAGQLAQVSRGNGVWRRDVVTSATPADLTTNMTAGETYSPPGLWSGTPLHVHDRDAPAEGESDLEEVYYHLARLTDGAWGPYSVQMLFDNEGLNKAYVVGNHDAVAIPGAAHSVVAGPASDIIYLWALAGPKATDLKMRDVAEFAYMKKIGSVMETLEGERGAYAVSAERLAGLADEHGLSRPHEREMLKQHLSERGFGME